MGFLAPLFLAGLAALSLPLLFHLVRRTPRGRQEFSSLMFLAPTPPRLTRRSRLDQILLLLLRLGALVLLAMAFARPFLRESALLSLSDLPRRRVAIVVDTSASMQRADLWRQAVQQVERELDDLAPHDEVALFTFSDRLETVAGFASDSNAASGSQADVVRSRLRELKPTWSTSDLGTALTTLAGELEAAADVKQSLALPQIVAVSDFQKGSRIEALQAFEWPERVQIVARQLKPQRTTNAFAQLLPHDEEATDDVPRVRIVNATDSSGDQFFIAWSSERSTPAESDVAVYVPPGQSRVIKLPRPESDLTADRIVLRGDDHEFDNTYFVVPPRKQQAVIVYAGADAADDPQGLQYYLQLAASGDPLRQVSVQVIEGDAIQSAGGTGADGEPRLLVASRAPSEALQSELTRFAEQGGIVMLVPGSDEAAQALPRLFEDVQAEPATARRGKSDFALLGEIDFTHALFAPFANPRYSDFTRIHFWRHWPIAIVPRGEAASRTQVIARFDNGEPWLVERPLGKGRILALTSGWNPDDSQLAVSSKFVPLIGNLLDLAYGSSRLLASVTVGGQVAVNAMQRSRVVVLPDGSQQTLPPAAEAFAGTAAPGIYRVEGANEELRFAVNVAASESDTAPIDLEQLEQFGVRRGVDLTSDERLSRIRQQRDTELESRQKLWRWLIVGCLALLIVETLWAGRQSSNVQKNTPEAVA